MSDIIQPFSDNQQKLLKIVDAACQSQMKVLKEEFTRRNLAGDPLDLDPETTGWMNIITAYGLLYNRCVEAGWIDDVVLTQLTEGDDEQESVD
jgi:hypothetical protein